MSAFYKSLSAVIPHNFPKQAVDVFPEENYMLRIGFDNGETKRFDVKPYIQGEWYGRLAENTLTLYTILYIGWRKRLKWQRMSSRKR